MDDDVQAMENNKKNTDYPKLDKNLRMCSRLKPGSLFPSPSPFRVESLRTRLGAELQTRVRAREKLVSCSLATMDSKSNKVPKVV